MPGLYWHRITDAAGKKFFSETWKVAPDADRMGYRFKGGSPLEFVDLEQPFSAGSDPSNITDAPYAYGSIQVPSGTEPIVLHRDAVSGGGFFTLGTVISADMDFIGSKLAVPAWQSAIGLQAVPFNLALNGIALSGPIVPVCFGVLG